jgi:hypothetical protein
MPNITNNQRLMCLTGAVLGWFALIGQLYLSIEMRKASLAEALVTYFSYFTILSNLIMTLCFTALLTGRATFFHKAGTQTAIAVYIVVVGIVYNAILRFLWQPQGLQRFVDELLHTVNPLFYFIYWFIYNGKSRLAWKQALPWLWYPLVYLAYTLLRGSIVHFYPYPFIDVDQKGYGPVLVACVLLTFVFLGLALLLIAITRRKNRKVIA